MTDERIRKGPSGPPIDVFDPSPSDANSIPVVNAAGDGFDMLAPGTDGQVVTSRDGVWIVGDTIVDDPPAMLVTIFGTNRFYAFSASQINESNEEEPKYQWTIPGLSDAGIPASIAPDGSIFFPSATFNAVMRATVRNSGDLNVYRVASAPAGATSPGYASAFAGQAPATALDPWTYYTGRSLAAGNLLRWAPGTTRGSTQPAWSTPTTYTGLNNPNDMCFDVTGNLWAAAGSVADRYTVASVTGAPGALSSAVNITGSNWPSTTQSIAVSSAGDYWRARYAGGGDIRMLNAAGVTAIVGAGPSNPVPTVIITSTEIRGAQGLIFDYSGRLWAASYDNHRVMCFAAADLTSSGAKTPTIVLTGGGVLGNGGSTGPVFIRWFPGYGPLR